MSISTYRVLLSALAIGPILVIAGAASAEQVVVTLDGVPATMCGETWTESGVELSFIDTASEDCDGGGNCSFGIGSSAVDLFPARLNLDLSGLSGPVASAEVDVEDFCGTGCTRAFLYQGATLVDSASNAGGGAQTLLLDAGGAPVDRLAVSSCEGSATEVRLEVAAAVPGLGASGLVALAVAMLAGGLVVMRAAKRSPVS